MLDLRIPIGGFFTVLGVILLALGLFAPQLHAALTTVNVNLECGCVMTVFGLFMLLLSWRAARKPS
jgi:hypothetical protein